MIIRKAYQFKLKTAADLEEKLSQMAGSCRFVWNKALAMNLERLKNKHGLFWYNELAFWLKFWKQTDELNFLKSCPSQALQQTLMRLDKAFKDGFDKKQKNKRIPVFKRKWGKDSFSYPQGFKIDNRRVFLPKLGWLSFHKSRKILGKAKNLTVKKMGDGWYISIQVEVEVKEPRHPSKSTVGIDLGITRFATLSTGEFFKPLNSFKKHEKKLIKIQRKLSRQEKRSSSWRKQKKKLARVHQKIRDSRLDYLHWVSSKVSKNHAIVILEDLKVKNMSKARKGSLENPGRNVKAKSGLNKSIIDQGWRQFRDLLSYKQQYLGGEVLFVNPQYTSQKCPICSTIDARNRLSQAEFCCIKCAYRNNADVVGAMNALAAGLAVMACQANPKRGRQQESARNRKGVLSLSKVA